jgi:N-acetylneuraminic acid mutarotase
MNTATEVYDITSNTWQTLAPYPGSTNPYGIMAAAYNGKIYTFYQKKTYEYNPANDTWTEKAPIPTSKAQGSAEVIDDKIYIASSLSDKKFHIYDPLRNRWTAGPDIPVSMHYTEAAVSEGKLYILGGTIGEHGTHKMVHVYDPCAQSWRKIADMTLASATHSSTTVK